MTAQLKSDDQVLRLRVRSILKYLGGMLQEADQPLTADLQAVKARADIFVECNKDLVPDQLNTAGWHTIYMVEALMSAPLFISTVEDLKMLADAGRLSVLMTEAGPTPVAESLLNELHKEHGK